MTEKIKFKAANPPKIMKYDHFAHSAMACNASVSLKLWSAYAFLKIKNVIIIIVTRFRYANKCKKAK